MLLLAIPLRSVDRSGILWSAPAILLSSLAIAWAAESAQFFMAQGFALAILAWLQTMPEFAIEAVLAWKRQTPLLLANLTGALRLLTGFGWPVIYLTAAAVYRRRSGERLKKIRLDEHHAVEVVTLLAALLYIAFICLKGSLSVLDGAVLIAIYAAYLAILRRLPPEAPESIDELEAIPRAIVKSPRGRRIAIIAALFGAGGLLIYFSAEPFLGSLMAISAALGVPAFVFIQWIAPVISEFPEMASTIYFARTVERAPMALMNMVSSNINQWTLLVAMLVIVFSVSSGHAVILSFDDQQRFELLVTFGQALLGTMFLLRMELTWWQAGGLLVLFLIPFANDAAEKGSLIVYFAWAAIEFVRLLFERRMPPAIAEFAIAWRRHVIRGAKI